MTINRLSMRKLNDILRLHYEPGLSRRSIASALNSGYQQNYECPDNMEKYLIDFS